MQYGMDNRYSMLLHNSSLVKASKSNARSIPCKDRCGIRIVIDTFDRGNLMDFELCRVVRKLLHGPAFCNDIAPWMRFKKVYNDAAVIKTKKIEIPHNLIYFDENSLNEEFITTLPIAD
jgi:hypothetical protein